MRKICKDSPLSLFFLSPQSFSLSAALLTLVATGCSSDVTRLNSSSFSLADNSLSNSATSLAPVKGPYSLGHSLIGEEAYPVSEVADHSITRGDLSPPENILSSTSAPQVSDIPAWKQGATLGPTSEFEVKQGDTLYRLSQRTGISQEELIRLNTLKSATLRAGQKIKVPSEKLAHLTQHVSAQKERIVSESHSPEVNVSDHGLQKDFQNRDTMKSESSQKDVVASSLDLSKHEVKSENYSRTPLPLTPSERSSQEEMKPADPPPQRMASLEESEGSSSLDAASSSAPPLKLLNEPNVRAEQTPNTLNTLTNPQKVSNSAEPHSEAGRFRWPVKGRIITPFGQRSDGSMNDGIDISVPLGTEIHAAEDGVVAYAGSQLKAYGNLILVRHEKGMVTAYAHAEELKVKRGDRITRGQVIATAGKTGDVDQPKLHFELRDGPNPVDPLLHLEKL